MKVEAGLKTKEETLVTLRSFLANLLKEGIVDYLLVPQEISNGRTLTQTLVTKPANLGGANPFSPVMPMNSASIVSKLTARKPKKKLGAVLKPCEIRALVELVKLGQASLEHLVIIGTDCLGTYEIEDYAKYVDNMGDTQEEKGERILSEMHRNMTQSDEGIPLPLRLACQTCNAITPPLADIILSPFGSDDSIIVCLENDMVEKFGLEGIESSDRQAAIAEISNRRTVMRDKLFTEFREKMKTITDFADALVTCTRCYACQSACPICYCRICFFHTETFQPESERYFRWAEKENALRMPTEILLYHLTRLNHIAASCVGCGLCESTCPRHLPLTTIFKSVGDGVQKKLNYEPGRSTEDEIPIFKFKEGEN